MVHAIFTHITPVVCAPAHRLENLTGLSKQILNQIIIFYNFWVVITS